MFGHTTTAVTLGLVLATASLTAAQDSTDRDATSAPSHSREIADGDNVFLLRLRPADPRLALNPTPEEAAVIDEHFVRLQEYVDRGVIMFVGLTVPGEAEIFGLVLILTDSWEDAEAIMNGDPAIESGLMLGDLFRFRMSLIGESYRGLAAAAD